jgi:hypothetical protein
MAAYLGEEGLIICWTVRFDLYRFIARKQAMLLRFLRDACLHCGIDTDFHDAVA